MMVSKLSSKTHHINVENGDEDDIPKCSTNGLV